jgi:hypothetical protein
MQLMRRYHSNSQDNACTDRDIANPVARTLVGGHLETPVEAIRNRIQSTLFIFAHVLLRAREMLRGGLKSFCDVYNDTHCYS